MNNSPSWNTPVKKSIENGSVQQPTSERKHHASLPKKKVATTIFTANTQWLNRVEKVLKAASPTTKRINTDNPNPNPNPNPNHFKAGKVTPPSAKVSPMRNKSTASTN